MCPDKVNLAEKFGTFSETWTPKIIGELDGYDLKIAKIEGEFVWHKHDNEDELFVVISGEMDLEFRDRTVALSPGELIVVPMGVKHRPRAANGAEILLIEKKGTLNTGDQADSDMTVAEVERI